MKRKTQETKKSYLIPQITKFDSLKELTLVTPWQWNGECPGTDTTAPIGSCQFGVNFE